MTMWMIWVLLSTPPRMEALLQVDSGSADQDLEPIVVSGTRVRKNIQQ